MNKRQLGTQKETVAAAYLEKEGYEIVERNYYTRHGEIDIIAKEEEYLVFVEVKYRSDKDYGTPAQNINKAKIKHLEYSARAYLYLKGYPDNTPVRFDVVEILGSEINLIRNAFY